MSNADSSVNIENLEKKSEARDRLEESLEGGKVKEKWKNL